jgi:polysaccharide deacetylase 2 family uncharacterized protein YibQ
MPAKKTNRAKMTQGQKPSVQALFAALKSNFSPKVFVITLCIGIAAAIGGGFAVYNTDSAPNIAAWPYVEITIEPTLNLAEDGDQNTEHQTAVDHQTPEADAHQGEEFTAEYSTEDQDRYVIDLTHNEKLYDTIDDNIIVPRRAGSDTIFEAYRSPLFADIKSQSHKGLISLVMVDYGLSPKITQQVDTAFKDIHLSYALSPYAVDPQPLLDNARKNGHEVWLSLQLQPKKFPWVDTGPTTLLLESKPDENRRRLIWLLSLVRGYPGIISVNDSAYESSEGDLNSLFSALHQHGVGYVDASLAVNTLLQDSAKVQKVPFAQNKLWLTQPQSIENLSSKLSQLEDMALNNPNNDSVVAFFHPHPKVIGAIAQWAKKISVEKSIVVVPLSFQVTNQ